MAIRFNVFFSIPPVPGLRPEGLLPSGSGIGCKFLRLVLHPIAASKPVPHPAQARMVSAAFQRAGPSAAPTPRPA